MILADTSIWVEHLRRGHEGLAALLKEGRVAVHPFVIGEIALGSLRHREEVLGLLAELPSVRVAAHEEVMTVVERRGLAAAGVGWVDAHLMASALLDRIPLWTLDRRLASAAAKVGAAWNG